VSVRNEDLVFLKHKVPSLGENASFPRTTNPIVFLRHKVSRLCS